MKDLRIKKDPGKIVFALGCVLIFLLLFYCNLKTRLIADDYSYSFSFADGQRMVSFSQLIPSMVAHRQKVNGRIIAHFLVQLFLMLPQIFARVLNAAMFTLLPILTVYMGKKVTGNKNPWLMSLMLGFAFASIWIYEPAFGQVNLWTDGAFNYLWSTVLTLIYIFMYLLFCGADDSDHSRKNHWVAKCAFLFFSLVIGAYSENGAVAAGAFAVVFMLLRVLVEKKHSTPLQWVSIVFIMIGFAYMMLAPAEALKVADGYSAKKFIESLAEILGWLKEFWTLCTMAAVLLIVAIVKNKRTSVIVFAASCVFAALAASLSMVFASWVPDRCFCHTVVLLTVACVILGIELYNDIKEIVLSAAILVIMASTYYVTEGVRDIIITDYQIRYNESCIMLSVANGEDTAYVKPVQPYSKYTIASGIIFMDADPSSWVNQSVAKYYGVDKIICTPYEREEYERRAALQEEQNADKQQDESAEPGANG